METAPLTAEDELLVDHVRETNEATVETDFFDGAHIVAAGVRVADGSIFEGVSLPASIGRASVCAEPVAVGSAVTAGYSHDDIETCVAVAYPMADHETDEQRVIPPCGTCRELLADYNEGMDVIVPVDGGNRTAKALDLLPTRPW